MPTSVITKLARQQAQTVDFATSNVRGSSTPVYIAGAELTELSSGQPLPDTLASNNAYLGAKPIADALADRVAELNEQVQSLLKQISEMIKPLIKEEQSKAGRGKVLVGTVEGDIHDFRERAVAYMIGARDDYASETIA